MTIEQERIISQTADYVRKTLEGESSGHDWWHVFRVWKNAIHIGGEEKGVDMFVVQLAALLHDIADWKFHGGDDSVGPKVAWEWMEKQNIDDSVIAHVCEIIKNISFKGAGVQNSIATKEGMVVQDAEESKNASENLKAEAIKKPDAAYCTAPRTFCTRERPGMVLSANRPLSSPSIAHR